MGTIERSSSWLSRLFMAIAAIALLYVLFPLFLSDEAGQVGNTVMDIGIHDTYFVTSNASIFGSMAIVALCFSLFYARYTELTRLRLSAVLGWTHFIGSSVAVLLPAPLVYRSIALSAAPRRYYSYSETPMFEDDGVIDLMTLLVALLIIGQACFVINVAVSPFRKKTT